MRMKFFCAFYGLLENRATDLIGLNLSGRFFARMIRDGGCASGVPPLPPLFLFKVFILNELLAKYSF
jgi:hypothetical protein